MLCIGFTANAQQAKKHKQKGIQAYPIYFLQGLEFEQDSSVIGLYGWIKPEDRMAVFQEDHRVVALVMDTLSSLPEMEITPINAIDSLLIKDKNLIADSALIHEQMSLDSIYFWDDFYDYDPDWDGVELSADSLSTKPLALDSMQTDSEIEVIVLNDSLISSSETGMPVDSISSSLDSLEIDSDLPDSTQTQSAIAIDSMVVAVPEPVIVSLAMDTLAIATLPVDTTAIEMKLDTLPPVINPIEMDSLINPTPKKIETQPTDTTSIGLGSNQGAILLKSDPILLGDYRLSRPQLDTSLNRRRILDRTSEVPQAEVQKTIESRVDTIVVVQRIIEQTPAVVTERIIEKTPVAVPERSIEKPVEYTGQYAGLSKAERERQLRLDAEGRRKAEAAEVSMEKAKLDAELSADDRVEAARAAQRQAEAALAVALAAQAKENTASPQSAVSTDDSTTTSTTREGVVIIPQRKVTVQSDKGTEKAVAQLAARMDEQAAKAEQLRAADNEKLEGRFDRIESKMDTLLNALGKKVVMNEAVYSIPKEEMNIYFAINSHTISAHSLMDLESYLSQLKELTDYRIVLSGFADSSGNLEYNKLLVSKRIASVKDAILTMGISPTELLVNNYGKQKANAAKTFNQLDRKVAIQIFSVE